MAITAEKFLLINEFPAAKTPVLCGICHQKVFNTVLFLQGSDGLCSWAMLFYSDWTGCILNVDWPHSPQEMLMPELQSQPSH